MKVSSPVGEFPFEMRRVSLRGGRLRLEGAMGAWPAHVELGVDDVPPLLRAMASVPAIAAGVGAACLLVVSARRRSAR